MNAREAVLDAAAGLLRDPTGPSLTLESAARAAGVSKPGLMYHFPTKEALVRGTVERVVDDWERRLRAQLSIPFEDATPAQRIRAYVRASIEGPDRDPVELAVYAQPGLRGQLVALWADRVRPWVTLPDSMTARERARLEAARLAADGAWVAMATGILPPAPALLPELLAVLEGLLEDRP